MPIINFTEPLTLIIGVVLFVLVAYLGKSTNKSWVIAIMLFVFIALLIGYAVEFLILNVNSVDFAEVQLNLIRTSGITLLFILLSFMMYLWTDDNEAKLGKRKSIDDSLDWFWKKV